MADSTDNRRDHIHDHAEDPDSVYHGHGDTVHIRKNIQLSVTGDVQSGAVPAARTSLLSWHRLGEVSDALSFIPQYWKCRGKDECFSCCIVFGNMHFDYTSLQKRTYKVNSVLQIMCEIRYRECSL